MCVCMCGYVSVRSWVDEWWHGCGCLIVGTNAHTHMPVETQDGCRSHVQMLSHHILHVMVSHQTQSSDMDLPHAPAYRNVIQALGTSCFCLPTLE